MLQSALIARSEATKQSQGQMLQLPGVHQWIACLGFNLGSLALTKFLLTFRKLFLICVRSRPPRALSGFRAGDRGREAAPAAWTSESASREALANGVSPRPVRGEPAHVEEDEMPSNPPVRHYDRSAAQFA